MGRGTNDSGKLPDTPWHVGFAKKQEDDPRRHKARCIHLRYDKSCGFMSKCIGSSHCDYYAETYEQDKLNRANKRTNEQESAIRGNEYKTKMIEKINSLLITDNMHFYDKYWGMRDCPNCGERLKENKEGVKTCPYCKAYFCLEGHEKQGCFIIHKNRVG